MLSRTLAGARTVLVVAPLATLFCLFFGGLIGLVSGYYRGLTDEIVMRFVDVLLSLPVIVAAIVVVSALRTHTQGSAVAQTAVVILVIGVLFTPSVARTVRAAAVSETESEYVMAARLRGEGTLYCVFRSKPNTDSAPSRTLIPRQVEHRFRRQAEHRFRRQAEHFPGPAAESLGGC